MGFVNTPLGREMGMRYSNDQRMTAETKKHFLKVVVNFYMKKQKNLVNKKKREILLCVSVRVCACVKKLNIKSRIFFIKDQKSSST